MSLITKHFIFGWEWEFTALLGETTKLDFIERLICVSAYVLQDLLSSQRAVLSRPSSGISAWVAAISLDVRKWSISLPET